jgi:hypothetical protein
MNKLAWYWRRLRVMGFSEIVHRLAEAARGARFRVDHALGIAARRHRAIRAADFAFCNSATRRLPRLRFASEFDAAARRALLDGHRPALGHEWQWRDAAEAWHRAPDTGRAWPRSFFGAIDYRAGNPYGDARVTWEPARLQHLVDLAVLADTSATDRDVATALLADMLASWMTHNPPGGGIHYVSAMECGLRLVAVLYAVDIARPALGTRPDAWQATAQLVASHAPQIAGRLSLHSSAGNHTIAECVALVHAGLLFPELPGAAGWLRSGLDLLASEADRQVLPDGGGIEGSTWYHWFVVDLLGLAQALLDHHARPVPAPLRAAVQRGRSFLAALAPGPEGLPRFGDADDGNALSPRLRISWPDAPLPAKFRVFPDFGLSVVPVSAQQVLFLRHGPLGMPPLFGHGHADALAVCLHGDGVPILTDTGTFTYTGDPQWRAYFRGTAAHNTVRVDGRDQARQDSPFKWSDPYAAELVAHTVRHDGIIVLEARHDGYADLGVMHTRKVIVVPDTLVIVRDTLSGSGMHELELHWHCGVEPERVGDALRLRAGGGSVQMRFADRGFELHRGDTEPPRGWRSPGYGRREPITTVRQATRGALPVEFTTIIELGGSTASPAEIERLLGLGRPQ